MNPHAESESHTPSSITCLPRESIGSGQDLGEAWDEVLELYDLSHE